MDWSKWNPFKFKRSEKEQTLAPVAQRNVGASQHQLAHAPWTSMDPARMMQEFWQNPFAGLANIDRWFGDFSAPRFSPSVDVVDDGKALRVSAELPGMEKDDVQLLIEDGTLTLKGEKKFNETHEQDGCYRIERGHGVFMRSVPLPTGLDTDHAEAQFKNGVLEVKIPKLEAAPSGRKIAIT